MKRLLLLIIFVLALSGCKTTQKVHTEYYTEIVEVHDTIRDIQVRILRDSIYLHDSIIITQDTSGRVIYREKYVYRDLWHDAETKIVHDSIVIYKDSKESDQTNKEVIENKPWYLPFAVWGSMGFLVCLLFYAIKKLI